MDHGLKVLPLLAIATALVPVGCGSTSSNGTTSSAPVASKGRPGSVAVVLDEWTLVPTPISAKAGKVTFETKNSGNVKHELVVVKTEKPAASLPRQGATADETGKVGDTGDVDSGESKPLSLTLSAGHYALICNLPGHYQAGQHADFTVK